MSICVCGGASLQCSFGTAPSNLMVLPANRVVSKMPLATITDNVPFVNILPFGICRSMSNPTVASATASALGVFTPMLCIPEIVGPWIPGNHKVLIGGYPSLNDKSTLMCAWGGIITVQWSEGNNIIIQ